MKGKGLALPLQSEAVAYHAYAAKCHSGTGQHRIEKEPIDREKQTCGNWNPDKVVNKSPEEVLPYCPYGLP